MKVDQMTLYKRLATQGAVGYTQAPGTYATFMAIPMVWVLTHMHLTIVQYLSIVAILWIGAWYVIDRALPECTTHDPAEIVLDEAMNFALVFIACVPTIAQLCAGFALFRLFDIYKPFGIRAIEKFDGALPIMLDDLVAALYSCAVLHLALYAGLL